MLLEDELQLLSFNTSNTDNFVHSQDNADAVERVSRAARPTSGRRYPGSRNATTTYTGSGRSRTRGRFRQRPGVTRKPQKGSRQRGRNRGRKFRGMWWKNRMKTQQTGAGSGRRLKSQNATTSLTDLQQSDAAYNAPPTSDVGGASLAEGQEEMTNTLEPSDGHQQMKQNPGFPYQLRRSCDEMRCQRGGYCVMDDRQGRPRPRCQCPLGTRGHQCDTGPCTSRYCLASRVPFLT